MERPYRTALRWGSLPVRQSAFTIVVAVSVLVALILSPGRSLLERLQWLDSGICAQLLTHSFYPGGQRLPLCARNTGIYLGLLVTLLFLHACGHGRAQRLPPRAICLLLIGCIGALAIDGLNSFFLDLGLPHLYQPQNSLRLATGLLMGLALGGLLLPLTNRMLWRNDNEQASFASWRELLLITPVLLICFFAVITQNALMLYPLAILSTAGLLVALGIFNLLVGVVVARRDESFLRYRDLWSFCGLALACAIGELLTLAQLKVLLLHLLGS